MPTLAGTWYRSRVELRHRFGSVLFLALLVALIVGGVLGVAIGDRRNATAYDRLVRSGGGPDLVVLPGQGPDGYEGRLDADRVRAVDGVRHVSVVDGFAGIPGVGPPSFSNWVFEVWGSSDPHLLERSMRPIVVSGRLAGRDRVDEAVVNEEFAKQYGVTAGDAFPVRIFASDQATHPVKIRFRITGVVRFPDEIVQSENSRETVLFTSPAFSTAHPRSVAYRMLAVDVDDPEVDTVPVRRSISALVPTSPPGYATMVNRRSTVRLATCAVNSTMIVFGIVFGLLGLIVIGQSVSRLQRSRIRDSEVLEALGAPPTTRFAIALAVPGLAVLLGLAGAAALSTLLSPLFPVGVARRAEPNPGFSLNVGWTIAGIAIAAVVLGLLVAGVSWQYVTAQRDRTSTVRASQLVVWMRRVGLPLSAVCGARRALTTSPGHASTRRGMVGVALAMAGIVLMLVFTANVRAVVHDPDRFGWSWDELVEMNGAPSSAPVRSVVETLNRSASVEAVGLYSPLPVTVNGVLFPAIAVAATSRPVPVELVRGRAPVGTSEITLGGRTMRRLGVDIGDRVALGIPGSPRKISVAVVGEVVLPSAAVVLASDSTSLGYGVLGPTTTIGRLVEVPQAGVAIRFRPGATPVDRRAALAPFRSALAEGSAMRVSGVQRPDGIVGLDQIGLLPTALAASLALLVVAGLGLTLVSSTQSRRRDLAVLKSMGFVRSQLVGIVMWEATVSALLATVVGAVVGTALGRFAWLVMTGDLAIAPTIRTPVATVVLAVVVAVSVANAVALIPAQVAARTPVSAILKDE